MRLNGSDLKKKKKKIKYTCKTKKEKIAAYLKNTNKLYGVYASENNTL